MAILQPLKSSGRSNNEEIPIAFMVLLILTSCYTNGDTLIAVKEAHPDSEIYQIKINEFILVDSIGIWYVNANMGLKEPYTEKQLVKLWNNHGRN